MLKKLDITILKKCDSLSTPPAPHKNLFCTFSARGACAARELNLTKKEIFMHFPANNWLIWIFNILHLPIDGATLLDAYDNLHKIKNMNLAPDPHTHTLANIVSKIFYVRVLRIQLIRWSSISNQHGSTMWGNNAIIAS